MVRMQGVNTHGKLQTVPGHHPALIRCHSAALRVEVCGDSGNSVQRCIQGTQNKLVFSVCENLSCVHFVFYLCHPSRKVSSLS